MTLDDFEVVVYDCEVFAEDWLFVLKGRFGTEAVWNDPGRLAEFVEEHADAVFAGFNSKHYDRWILAAVLAGCDPPEVKEVNDWIIGTDEPPWEHPYLKGSFGCGIHSTDLMDDMQKGTSLKSIEGHLGMSIEESSVPFDIGRKLTAEEREEVERYCVHDVEATERLLDLRRGYLDTKLHLAELAGIDPYRALGMTDPKLAAALFGASPLEDPDRDARAYEFPDKLDYSLVPQGVVGFFERISDESVGDDELFASTYETEIAGCPVTYAFGGIHGALPKHREGAGDGRIILNYDVSSLYPSLMIGFGYVSRSVPDPAVFSDIRDERFAAKKQGDKATANALKSPMNKAYGAMGNQYNDMYDPLMKLSVCVSGQLAITQLACSYERIDGLRIIQLNTDGIMLSIPEARYGDVLAANEEWQEATALELEEDRVALVWQKDVNNYAMRKTDGSVKLKGGYLVRGVSPVGAWSINNNAPVVADAVAAYLLDGTPVRETVEACDDVSRFQLIAKASHKYSRVFQEVFPEPVGTSVETVERQKCNRVFATADARYGRLYKVKRENGQVAKIENLPEHCLVANGGKETFPEKSLIDITYYVALAEKRARDFEKEEEVATTKSAPKAQEKPDYSGWNVHRKLAAARRMFADSGVTKSGVNSPQEYDYFELDDIVPAQNRIFEELGLFEKFDYVQPYVIGYAGDGTPVLSEAVATATVYNTDDPAQFLVFWLKWGEVPPILNKNGKEVNIDAQRRGGEMTYMRRYLKMAVLDIVESDSVDSAATAKAAEAAAPKEKAPSASKAAKPPTPVQRKKAAEAEASADGEATPLQIRQLKKGIKTISDEFGSEHPEVGEFIANLSATTAKLAHSASDESKPFSKAECESAIRAIGEMREKLSAGERA